VAATYPAVALAEVLHDALQDWDLHLFEDPNDRIMLVNMFCDAFPSLWEQHKLASRAASLPRAVTAELRWCAQQADALFTDDYIDTLATTSSPAPEGRRRSKRIASASRQAGAAS
jgi:hypothetical protein